MIHEPLDDLYLVDLDLPRPGFRRFVSAWVLHREGSAVLVDPGPRATVPALLHALEELGLERLDAILLTHIHIDHAGGAGLVLERFPGARVVCHPKAVPHLVDPTKLWAGSLKVLGDLAREYGEIAAVPEGSLGFEPVVELGRLRVEALETPGHAAHHLCFWAGGVLFAGELAGVRYPLPGRPYQRPATPPTFLHEEFRASIDAAAALPATHLCYGHYGLTDDPRGALARARDQLDRWVEAVAARAPDFDSEALFQELLAADPLFGRFSELPADVQARERHFFGNTLQGLRGYVEARGATRA